MKPTHTDPQDQDLSHLLTQQTLPWIVNGSASEAQRTSVAQHLLGCAACRAELEHQYLVRDALSQPPTHAPAVEPGLERLFKRLDLDAQFEQPAPTLAATPAPSRGGRTRTSYALAACVALQALALAALLPHWFAQDATDFKTLSQAPGTDAAPKAQIRVVPDGRFTLAEWNTLLDELGLQVSGGPNSAGAYALSFVDTRRSTAQTVARLRSTPGMRLVEPIGNSP